MPREEWCQNLLRDLRLAEKVIRARQLDAALRFADAQPTAGNRLDEGLRLPRRQPNPRLQTVGFRSLRARLDSAIELLLRMRQITRLERESRQA